MAVDGSGSSVTVLVADDDDDMRALVATTLRSDGYVVIEASDGAELLERLEGALPSEEYGHGPTSWSRT